MRLGSEAASARFSDIEHLFSWYQQHKTIAEFELHSDQFRVIVFAL